MVNNMHDNTTLADATIDQGRFVHHVSTARLPTKVGDFTCHAYRDHRGIGVAAKIAAYALQDAGCDTVEANTELGLPVDSRDHAPAGLILADLGISRVPLMSNNPTKFADIESCGVEVTERIAITSAPNPDNIGYLRTKQQRMGHLLDGLD